MGKKNRDKYASAQVGADTYDHGKMFTLSRKIALLLLLVVLIATTIIRLRLINLPLERDEGEYAYVGQLMLHGIPPFTTAINMKLPGTHAAYAAIMSVFGQTSAGIHLGFLFLNLATILLVFLLAERLFGSLSGLAAAASYAVLSMNHTIFGMHAHATHFVLLPALGGMIVMLKAVEVDRIRSYWWSGVLIGLAFIMKQQAVFFIPFAFGYILWDLARNRKIGWKEILKREGIFLLGVLLPYGLVCLILLFMGAFPAFWFWTITYAREYVSETPFSSAIERLQLALSPIISCSFLLWSLAGIGLIALVWKRRVTGNLVFMLGLLLFSFLTTCPGFFFRAHYFVTILPVISLLIGAVFNHAAQIKVGREFSNMAVALSVLVFLVAIGQSIYNEKEFLLTTDPFSASRMQYGMCPFPEAIEIANYIKAHSAKNDRVAVLGSEPEIYFSSGRMAGTQFLYTYPMVETQPFALQMQKQMAMEIETAHPLFIAVVSVSNSWLFRPNSPTLIMKWAHNYTNHNYKLVGIADMVPDGLTTYRWGNETAGYSLGKDQCILLFQRRDAPNGS